MLHLYLRRGVYHYNRRVPVEFIPYVGRRVVAFSLKTDSYEQACRLSGLKSAQLENYWNTLAATGRQHNNDEYLQAVKRAKVYGFTYIPVQQLAQVGVEQLVDRVNFVAERNFQKIPAASVLGGVSPPEILISDALETFWHANADIKLNKTEKEIRKWRNPRQLAVDNFIKVNGDIPINKIERCHMRNLRDWWLNRIEDDEYSPATANKNFRHVKAVVTTAREEHGMRMKEDEVREVFGKHEFNDDLYEPREPFETDYILNVLLNPTHMDGLQRHEIAMMEVMAETGLSASELVKIMPEDIHLDERYPHVEIRPRAKMMLKTKHRKRTMPLVGFALDAFRRFPHGFRQYTKDADEVTTSVNAHYRSKELFPSEKHSMYSLRHSFQDRLTNKRIGERIQTDLMGHKFEREKYGKGGWLETLYEDIKKIQLKPE